MRHLLMAVTLLAPAAMCLAQTGPEQQSSDAARFRSNAVTVFGGLMSTTDFASTAIFNLNYTPDAYDRSYGKRAWDNYIAGVDYERDLAELARDLRLRAEVGWDDLFGHYLSCCFIPHYPSQFAERTIATESMNHSGELRVGGKLRWENFRLAGVRFAVARTGGLKPVPPPLGRERDRERQRNGNAHVLGAVSPEAGVSLDSVPQLELVARVMHRSGAGGLFGGMKEAYNADVLGLRYRF